MSHAESPRSPWDGNLNINDYTYSKWLSGSILNAVDFSQLGKLDMISKPMLHVCGECSMQDEDSILVYNWRSLRHIYTLTMRVFLFIEFLSNSHLILYHEVLLHFRGCHRAYCAICNHTREYTTLVTHASPTYRLMYINIRHLQSPLLMQALLSAHSRTSRGTVWPTPWNKRRNARTSRAD